MIKNPSQFVADVVYINAYKDDKQCYLVGEYFAPLLGLDYIEFEKDIKNVNVAAQHNYIPGVTKTITVKPFSELKHLVFLRDNKSIKGYKDNQKLILLDAQDLKQLKYYYMGCKLENMEDYYQLQNILMVLDIANAVLSANNQMIQNIPLWKRWLSK